jgi:hypothetical protein
VVPYAQQQTGIASQLFGGGPYPQQQVAGFSPDQLAAMQGVQQLTPEQQAYLNQAQSQNAMLAGGAPSINAATGALTGLATGQNPYQQQAYGAAGGLLNNPYIQAAQQANQATISGQYLDPSRNQALQDYMNAGMAPIIANYQTATAPNILANAIGAGGLGSSGTAEAFEAAGSELSRSLGDYAANVMYPAYQQERQLQQQAIQGAPGLLAPTQQGISALSGLLGQQAGAATGLPGMYGPQQTAISQAPGLAQGAYMPSEQLMGIGTQQQQQLQNQLNAAFGNQMMPYQMEQMGANLIGALSGGGGQSFQVSRAPGGGSMK